jgi:hypothetical protein
MTKKRAGEAWRPADEYGRGLPNFTVNLMMRDVQRALTFYRGVLGAKVHYSDEDFAALEIRGTQFMLHADHAYDQHVLAERLRVRDGAERAWNCECWGLIRMPQKHAREPRMRK